MTQNQIIIHLFETNGHITNAMLKEHGILYTGRNRITAAWMKDYWRAKGKQIRHENGDEFMESQWILEQIPQEPGGIVEKQTFPAYYPKDGQGLFVLGV